MKRSASLALFVCLFAASAFAAIEGSWTASTDAEHPDRIHLETTTGHGDRSGTRMMLAELSGLSSAAMAAKTTSPVHFELRREAGTFTFDGTFRNGHGAGEFTFAPNVAMIGAIRALGIEPVLERRRASGDEEMLLTLARLDVSTAYMRSLIGEGYRLKLSEYVEGRIFDVTPEYIRAMRSAGYDRLAMKELVASKIHGASPEFAAAMGRLGYSKQPLDQLVAFRIHGVSPEMVETFAKLGYRNIPAHDLVSMRIFGVTPEFVGELRKAGYENVPVEKMISMKVRGITPAELGKLADSK